MINRNNVIPSPPFWGYQTIKDLSAEQAFSWINKKVLFQSRWAYQKLKKSKTEHEKFLQDEVEPKFISWKKKILDENIFEPIMKYGYWKCRSENDSIIILDEDGNAMTSFTFPRQKIAPHLCISDFFHPDKTDVIALSIASAGKKFSKLEKILYTENHYYDYFLLHGIGTELTEALAKYIHNKISRELKLPVQGNRKTAGKRFSFGYPACPDLEQNKILFELLKPELDGIALTENFQMVPEQSTSALICHHPEAKYFTLE